MDQHEMGGPTIAFVGFGEAANAFLAGWGLGGSGRVAAYDIRTENPDTSPRMRAHYTAAGVTGAETMADALADRDLVFCLVPPDQALTAARAAAEAIRPGTLYLDGAACSPETKRQAAEAIEPTGARYVDLAIMAPVFPKRHQTPLLVAGPHAEAALDALAGLDMRVTSAGATVGDAATVAMMRAVMVKGMEALTAECLLAARKAGVADAVIESLDGTEPGRKWAAKSANQLERMMVHGARRAAEMREAAATLQAIGLPSPMAAAAAEWQDRIGALGLPGGEADLGDRADRILDAL